VQWLEKAESVQRGQNHLHPKIERNLRGFLKEQFQVKKESSIFKKNPEKQIVQILN
jgi:hypothetical protein